MTLDLALFLGVMIAGMIFLGGITMGARRRRHRRKRIGG